MYKIRSDFVDYTGQRFGRLLVLGISQTKIGNRNAFDCLCDCGKTKIVLGKNMKNGITKSCGCLKESRRYTNHQRWKGYGEISGKFFYDKILGPRGVKRNEKPDVSIEYLWNLFLKQDRKCRFTGQKLHFPLETGGDCTASLDRIDSTKGYVEGNVQWVHKWINVMKQDMEDHEFIEWCSLVCKNSNSGV